MYISVKSSVPDLVIPVVYLDTRQTPDFWRIFKQKTFSVLRFSIFGVFFVENTQLHVIYDDIAPQDHIPRETPAP